MNQEDVMRYDVIIVGAGPSGLSAAIRLKQLAKQHHKELSICIVEKGAQIGSHILSGAVLDPQSLRKLLPKTWQTAPLDTKVTQDQFYILSKRGGFKLPTPRPMQNMGNYIISLGDLCRFLAQQAEELGCEIYTGFAATRVLYQADGHVIGVATGDMGIDKQGNQGSNYQPGIQLHATQTLFAEGCRGQLSEELMQKFELRKHCSPQTYALGIKEIWQVSKSKHHLGQVTHTVGWPLDNKTYGGSFIYHFSENRVALGFVVGLDYQNPWFDPYANSQLFKLHPMISDILHHGERIAYGARALNEGGYQSIPKLTFPGGALIGDSAGFLNVAKIKGIHTAMQSGMSAAEAIFDLFQLQTPQQEVVAYEEKIKHSWVYEELYKVRNIRPGFHSGLIRGLLNAAFETYISYGKSFWTLKHNVDYKTLQHAADAKKITYYKPDGKLTFDKASSVYLTNTFHEENQPCHLKLRNPDWAIDINYFEYASPETRYCPAGVYEIISHEVRPKLQINAQNCIHCKTCDIKDPRQNILWTAPEGGGGPNYTNM